MINPSDRSAGDAAAITTRPLHSFFEKMIDRKVNQSAMRSLDHFINDIVNFLSKICEIFYPAYRERLHSLLPKGIKYNMCGAPLYDCTANRDANKQMGLMRWSTDVSGEPGDFQIWIQRRRIIFNSDVSFIRKDGTLRTIINDVEGQPGHIRITRTETTGNATSWIINTEQPVETQITTMTGVRETIAYYNAIPQRENN